MPADADSSRRDACPNPYNATSQEYETEEVEAHRCKAFNQAVLVESCNALSPLWEVAEGGWARL